MSPINRAIHLARIGQHAEARNLLLKIVQEDENNEKAWLALSLLVDDIEDKIIALENAITINPTNEKAIKKLNQIHANHKPDTPEVSHHDLNIPENENVLRALKAFKEGDIPEAKAIVNYIIQFERPDKRTWMLFVRMAVTVEDKIKGLSETLKLDPHNKPAKEKLHQYEAIYNDPFQMAAYYQKHENYAKATQIYQELLKSSDPEIRKNAAQQRQILRQRRMVNDFDGQTYLPSSANFTWVRLSLTSPFVFFMLLIGHTDFKITLHTIQLMALMPLVILGSIFWVGGKIVPDHPLWYRILGEKGLENPLYRNSVAGSGLFFILFPYIIILILGINIFFSG